MESFLGQTLTTPQRFALSHALTSLKLDHINGAAAAPPIIRFWGKLSGLNNDYLIAQSIRFDDDNVIKQFYLSSDDGVTFGLLPPVNDFINERSKAMHERLTGDPAHQYKLPKPKKVRKVEDELKEEEEEEEEEAEEDQEEEPEEPEEDSDEPKQPKPVDPSKRKLTELERVSWIVHSIDHDTTIVPAGAFVLTPTRDVIPSTSFAGLSSFDAAKLSSYQLLRTAENDRTRARAHKQHVTNTADFLDTIADEKPKGVWRLITDNSGTKVVIRNLLWPGFEFRSEAGSSRWSCAYFGNGAINRDLPFMI